MLILHNTNSITEILEKYIETDDISATDTLNTLDVYGILTIDTHIVHSASAQKVDISVFGYSAISKPCTLECGLCRKVDGEFFSGGVISLPVFLSLICSDLFTSPWNLYESIKLQQISPISDLNLSSPISMMATPNQPLSQHPEETRYYTKDLESHFKIRLVEYTTDHPDLSPMLSNHDIRTDQFYDPESSLPTTAKLRSFISKTTKTNPSLYAKHVSKEKGFGCFSDTPIRNGDPVVLYAGMILKNPTSDYSWWYPSTFYDHETGRYMELGIDSAKVGNIARFVNHDDDPNMEVVPVTFGNRYHMVYVAKRDIGADEELTVSYGPDFWKNRKKI
ncbi:hypothetical protein HK098_007743 [Nowakowskiella sp. JEL0407]|nr:hypothetical protein HK098_007743 [Nowakowskiella sp. JEL0407]